jgi:CMP-N,N'-diacetyllegionaminic acid synthase
VRTLALIPARSGSRDVPNKNTRDFCGKPLFRWAAEVGLATCDRTYVCTDRVLHPGGGGGVGMIIAGPPIHTDTCPMLWVVQDAIDRVDGGDVIVLLQPTQPLRTADHIRAALEMLEETDADSVVSVVEIPAHYSPDYAVRVENNWLVVNEEGPTRRQEARKAYSRDGTVYAVRREVVESGSLYGDCCRALLIPHSQSVNIDDEEDWQRAEAMKGRTYVKQAG